jgi:hypothetical protein
MEKGESWQILEEAGREQGPGGRQRVDKVTEVRWQGKETRPLVI